MWKEAKTFEDTTRSNNPAQEKKLRKAVILFDAGKWISVAETFATEALMAKFSQNERLIKWY